VPYQKNDDAQKGMEQLTKRRDYLRTIIEFPWRIYLIQDGQAIKVTDDIVEHVGPGVKRYI